MFTIFAQPCVGLSFGGLAWFLGGANLENPGQAQTRTDKLTATHQVTHTHTHIHSHRHEHTHAHTHAHRHTHAHADTASRVGPLRCGTADRRNSAAIQSSGRSARHLLANYVPQVRHKCATRVCRMCATCAPNVCHMQPTCAPPMNHTCATCVSRVLPHM